MNLERDKFLTEYFGECWHEKGPVSGDSIHTQMKGICSKCGETLWIEGVFCYTERNLSTWEGFGWLWEKCQQLQPERFERMIDLMDIGTTCWTSDDKLLVDIQSEFIHPDRFADAVYEYLKGQS